VRVRRIFIDAGQTEGEGVGVAAVNGDVHDAHRVVRRSFIQVTPGEVAVISDQAAVET
jgi:hypothetical protein